MLSCSFATLLFDKNQTTYFSYFFKSSQQTLKALRFATVKKYASFKNKTNQTLTKTQGNSAFHAPVFSIFLVLDFTSSVFIRKEINFMLSCLR